MRVWQCDCCGMENDQRGCVKGPPQCPCYRSVHTLGLIGIQHCVICNRCMFHCPGSPFYEDPKEDHLYQYLDADAPIKQGAKPHCYLRFGLCNCENVGENELVADDQEYDPRPGKVCTRCWSWRLIAK